MKTLNPHLKSTLIAIGLYAGIFIVVTFLNLIAPSGPCTPGPGVMLLLFIAPLIVVVSFLTTLYSFFNGKKHFLIPLLIHSLVLLFILYRFQTI